MKISELFDVKNLATIVTGGASGIGLAYAEAMADNGARVALLDIDGAGLNRAVAKLRGKGGDIRGLVVDVTDRPALRAAIDNSFDQRSGSCGAALRSDASRIVLHASSS